MPKEFIPPHNEEAEQSVLGAILINKDSIGLVSDKIKPSDFYINDNGKIYEAMLTLFEHGKPIDILTVAKTLKKDKGEKISASYYSATTFN